MLIGQGAPKKRDKFVRQQKARESALDAENEPDAFEQAGRAPSTPVNLELEALVAARAAGVHWGDDATRGTVSAHARCLPLVACFHSRLFVTVSKKAEALLFVIGQMRDALALADTRISAVAHGLVSAADTDPSKLAAAFSESTAAIEESRATQAEAPLQQCITNLRGLLSRANNLAPRIEQRATLAQDATCARAMRAFPFPPFFLHHFSRAISSHVLVPPGISSTAWPTRSTAAWAPTRTSCAPSASARRLRSATSRSSQPRFKKNWSHS